MSERKLRLSITVWGVTGLALLALALLWVVLPPLIVDAYERRPGALLAGVISGQGRFPLEGYLLFVRRTVAAMAIAIATIGGSLPLLFRWGVRTGGALSARSTALLLAMMVGIIGGLRLITFGEAQDRDLMVYMTVAGGLLDGQSLYTDIWDHKPPAIHVTYAAAALLFGRSELAIWMLGVAAALGTMVACYRAGQMLGGRLGGVAAAALWTIASGDLLLQANQPNTEVFMNLCLAWAFVALLPRDEPPGAWRSVAAGLLFFVASLYKPVAIAIAAAVMAAWTLVRLRAFTDDAWPRRVWRALTPGVIVAVSAGLAWALVLGYYAATSRAAAFDEAVFAYNRDYAGSLAQNLLRSFVPTGAVVWTTAPYFPLLGVTLVGLGFSLRGRWTAASLILIAYIVGAWIAVAVPGRLYPHYYQLLLPPLAIGAGWLTVRALEARSELALTAIGAAVCLVLTTRTYQSFVFGDEVSTLKFGGYGYDLLETKRMSTWIERHAPPGAVVYHWGADPGVYFYARRSSPVAFAYNLPLIDGTERAARYTTRVLTQLAAKPPDLIVASRREFERRDHPIEVWIDERYRPVSGPEGVDRFVFLVPRARP